jgi:hypothetical protein
MEKLMDSSFRFSSKYLHINFGGVMKKIFFVCLVNIIFVYGCRENIVEFKDEDKFGKILINSSPGGADIYFENGKTGKVTPDSLTNLQPGNYSLKLRLNGYPDQTVTVNVRSGQKRSINIIFLGY